MAGDGELRANWNKALVEELAASCYSRVLTAAKGLLGSGAAYEAMWPTGSTAPGSMWRGLTDSLMRLVSPLPLLRSRVQGGSWVAPRRCVVWCDGGVGGESGGRGASRSGGSDEREQRVLAEILLVENVRKYNTVVGFGYRRLFYCCICSSSSSCREKVQDQTFCVRVSLCRCLSP